MTSIGETLRRERQKRNLEISKIAGELKISTRFIEAMERDDFSKLPGGVFTKSFVRQYAGFLGLDAEEAVAEVERATEPEPVVVPLSGKPKPDVPGMELDGLAGWNSIGEHSVSLRSWIKAGAWLVALMVVCSGVYWWWQRPRHPVQAHQSPPPKTTPSPQATLPAPPAPNTPVAAVPPTENPPIAPPKAAPTTASTSTPPAVTPQIPITAPNPNATVHVGVTADEPVWIRVEVNGKALFSGTLQAHETRNVDADGTVLLRVGNAGGVTLTLNGKPVGAVGPKGQIRIVQFTSGGFHIVSPPKSFDPLDRL